MTSEISRRIVDGEWKTEAVDAGGGGSAVVSCVLGRDAGIDIHDTGNHPILWDALYDNIWDFNTLDSIPTGLGMTFVFDGSSETVTTTEAGTWALTFQAVMSADDSWSGYFNNGTFQIGLPIYGGPGANRMSFPCPSMVLTLPEGLPLNIRYETLQAATSDPYNCNGYLSIVRLA